MTGTQDKTESAQEQADNALQRFADGFSWLRRSPVWHWPSEHGLDYEDVTFPARDGVPLEGWFIPVPTPATWPSGCSAGAWAPWPRSPR
jgi:hypothetical protein